MAAEVFSVSKPSAWRSLVETATTIQNKPHDEDNVKCVQSFQMRGNVITN